MVSVADSALPASPSQPWISEYWTILKESASEWSNDGAPRLGAALAYYTLFSISPLVLIAISIAGIFFGEEAVRGDLTSRLNQFFGHEAARMINDFAGAAAAQTTGNVITSAIGFVVVIFGATGFFAQLRDALNSLWKVRAIEKPGVLPTVWRYWWSIAMVLGAGFLLMVSLLLSAALGAVITFASSFAATTGVMLSAVHFLADFGVSTILFSLILKAVPDIRLPWRIALRGGVVTSILFTAGKAGFSLYLAESAFASMYGAAGAVMIFLLWTYYSSQILLFGAEITKSLARREREPVGPAAGFEMGHQR